MNTFGPQRYYLSTARRTAERIVEELRPLCQRIEIAGSIRRQCPLVGDIDLVIQVDPATQVAPLLDRVALQCRPVKRGAAAGSADREVASSSNGKVLIAKLKLLPALAARDYRHPNSPKSQTTRKWSMKKCGQQLPNVLGGVINPSWAEWFMGYPDGWTELRGLGNSIYPEVACRIFEAIAEQEGLR